MIAIVDAVRRSSYGRACIDHCTRLRGKSQASLSAASTWIAATLRGHRHHKCREIADDRIEACKKTCYCTRQPGRIKEAHQSSDPCEGGHPETRCGLKRSKRMPARSNRPEAARSMTNLARYGGSRTPPRRKPPVLGREIHEL